MASSRRRIRRAEERGKDTSKMVFHIPQNGKFPTPYEQGIRERYAEWYRPFMFNAFTGEEGGRVKL